MRRRRETAAQESRGWTGHQWGDGGDERDGEEEEDSDDVPDTDDYYVSLGQNKFTWVANL